MVSPSLKVSYCAVSTFSPKRSAAQLLCGVPSARSHGAEPRRGGCLGLGVSTDCALQRLIIHYMFTVRTERVKSEGLMRAEFEVGAASSPLAMCR